MSYVDLINALNRLSQALTSSPRPQVNPYFSIGAPFADKSQILQRGQQTSLQALPVLITGQLNPDGTVTNQQGTISVSITASTINVPVIIAGASINVPISIKDVNKGTNFGVWGGNGTAQQVLPDSSLNDLLLTGSMGWSNTRNASTEVLLDSTDRLSNHPFDRNASIIKKNYVSLDTPIGDTVRWTYTVPTAKWAIMLKATNKVVRNTVAAPAGTVESYIARTNQERITQAIILTNGVGDKDSDITGVCTMGAAGDSFTAHTRDTSVGGDVFFYACASFLEFDV